MGRFSYSEFLSEKRFSFSELLCDFLNTFCGNGTLLRAFFDLFFFVFSSLIGSLMIFILL